MAVIFMIKSIYLLISVLVVFGLPYHYSYKSQKLANTYAEGPFCWILPGADGPPLRGHVREMHLSLSPPNRLVFWGDIIKRTRRGIYTLPHFAVAIPTPAPQAASRLLGWSYTERDFYDLSEKASVLGIVWFPDDCATLIAKASS